MLAKWSHFNARSCIACKEFFGIAVKKLREVKILQQTTIDCAHNLKFDQYHFEIFLYYIDFEINNY